MRIFRRKPNRKKVNPERSITVIPDALYLDYEGEVSQQDVYRVWTADEGYESFSTVSVPAGATDEEVVDFYNSTTDLRK